MKDLKSLSKSQLEDFFSSFDTVLCDVHGVLWNVFDPIPGAPEAVSALQNIGKRFVVVSNNTTATLEDYHKECTDLNFPVKRDNIVTPTLTTISLLKRQNVTKDIFVLGTAPFKKSLQEAGFTVAPRGPLEIPETFSDFGAEATEDDGSVGAVVADIDLNVNYLNLQKAACYLKRPEVLFVKGAGDLRFSLGFDRVIMGPGVFHRILEDVSERSPVSTAKPSTCMNDYIVEKYGITDPGRVLFIGDSIPSDMGFATEFGYQKLLVLSGLTKDEALKEWKFPEKFKPDFYAESLGTIHYLISRLL